MKIKYNNWHSFNGVLFLYKLLGGDKMTDENKATTYVTAKDTLKRSTIKEMKDLGIHKPQYNRLIDIYAGMLHQYLRALYEFETTGYQYETETAAGNPKKSSLSSSLETLRKDILQYSDRLCLNPKSLENVTAESKSKSALANALSELDGR